MTVNLFSIIVEGDNNSRGRLLIMTNILVDGLNAKTTAQDLWAALSPFGTIKRIEFTDEPDAEPNLEAFVNIAARAVEVLGTRDKAMKWLRTPLPSLGEKTAISLLCSSEGIQSVEDALGQIEQGVW